MVMEVTAQALYLRKVEGIIFDVGYLQSTQDHLEFFGDMQTYAEAKLRLFEPGRCKRRSLILTTRQGAEPQRAQQPTHLTGMRI